MRILKTEREVLEFVDSLTPDEARELLRQLERSGHVGQYDEWEAQRTSRNAVVRERKKKASNVRWWIENFGDPRDESMVP